MKLLSKINRCDIFVSLYCLYYLQGALYTPGIINKCLQFGLGACAGRDFDEQIAD